jgi:DNA recombination protein RmuC
VQASLEQLWQDILVNSEQVILILLALAVIAILFLVFRKPPKPVIDPQLSADLARAKTEVTHLQSALAQVTGERDSLRAALSAEQITSARLGTQCDNISDQLEAAKHRHAAALQEAETGRKEQLARLDSELRTAQDQLAMLRETNAALSTDKRVLEETLRSQRDKHAELTAEIEQNRAQFINQFKAISSEILQNQGRVTTQAQKDELEKLLSPFKQELGFLKSGLKDMTEKAEKERQSLGQQIQLMQAQANELSKEANSLTLALRGDRKRQGNWGETILERVLEAAGLIEGTHFTKQATRTNEDGQRLVPDIVVHLPGARDVVIDSKVTLVAYQDMMMAAEDPVAEEEALKRHVAAVRAHMTGLSRKSYDQLGFDNIDSVLMFLPIEGALTAALSRAPDLVLEAAEKRIHILTPSTLMPILKIVDHLWTIDTRNKNVEVIVDRAGKLHDKFVSVVESIDDIGKHLQKASDSQAEAMKRMSTGAGNVLRQADELRQLGARSRKAMPEHLLGQADDSEMGDG